MRTREQTIYRYSELTGKAKDRARDWLIEGQQDFLRDELPERFEEMLSEAGFPKAEISYSLGHVQGDGVTFRMKNFDLRAWLEAQNLTKKFGKLAEEGGLNIYIHGDSRGFNPPTVSVEPTYDPTDAEEEAIESLQEAIQDSIYGVCGEMARIGYEIIDFRESDEELAEHAEANDYEFDAEGRPA